MRDRDTRRWSTYESFYIELGSKKIADIKVTAHAKKRWSERVSEEPATFESIADYIWNHVENRKVELYYSGHEDVYILDHDLVFVAEFEDSIENMDIAGLPLQRMIIVTFLGKMSEIIELRDLKAYYSWLRHGRRKNLMKNNRKKK